MLDQKTLDQLWNFEDPAAVRSPFPGGARRSTLRRRRAGRTRHPAGAGHRAAGPLRGGRRPAGLRSTADEPTVGVRVLLERGRVLNSSGHAAMAVPLFEQAAELADHLGEEFLAVDALHMLAIADSAHAEPGPGARWSTPPRSTMSGPNAGWWRCTTTWAGRCTARAGCTEAWWSSSSPNSGPNGSGTPAQRSAPARPSRSASRRCPPTDCAHAGVRLEWALNHPPTKGISRDLHRRQVQGQAGLVRQAGSASWTDFTQATRQEPGNLWFDWSRSVEDPNEFVLVEAFKDDAAGDHVNSAHFKKAMADMPQALAETPGSSAASSTATAGTDGRTHHLSPSR